MRKTTLAGIALILFTNAVVLLGVAWNRSGAPESELPLTQRELHTPWISNPENSGLALSMIWRISGSSPYFPGGNPKWLDAKKMQSLGFDAPHQNGSASREVLLVLEMDGPAWKEELASAEKHAQEEEAKLALHPEDKRQQSIAKQARLMVDREKTQNSRLFAIDAGLSLDALRAKYPDRHRYAILHARVRPWSDGHGHFSGHVEAMSGEIHVPNELRPAFTQKSFIAEIAFGRRLEPWLASARN